MTFKHEARRPSTAWFVVADRSRARIFAAEWPTLDGFCEVETLIHPEAELHQRDVESDGAGRVFEAQGPKHAAQVRTDFKHRTAREFAAQVVQVLQHGKDEQAFGRLVLVAPPLFLGVLREQLPAPLSKLVVADLDKDLTHLGLKPIEAEIRNRIAPAEKS